jgi:LemA protein
MQQKLEEQDGEALGYKPEEYGEIVRRAQQVRADKENRLSHEALAESAAEVGIREEDLREAARQLREEKAQQTVHRAAQKQQRTMIGSVTAGVLALTLLFSYNTLNVSRAEVEKARANVQATLQRRADVAQQLVTVTREGARQEEEALKLIREAAPALGSTNLREQTEAAEKLDRGVDQILSNPEVRSSELYAKLQDTIEGSENRVAEYRKRYNEAAGNYNRNAGSFPTNLVRPFIGMPASVPLYEAPRNVEQAPDFSR